MKTEKKTRKTKNVVWLGSVLCGLFGLASCAESDSPLGGEVTDQPIVKARIADYDKSVETLEGEKQIDHIQACQFIGGNLAKVYDNLHFDGGSCEIQVTDYEGTLYVLANTEGLVDLQELGDRNITEEEWKQTVLHLKDGKEAHFFSSSLNLDAYDKSQVELPLLLKRGVARFDLDIRTAGVTSVKSLTLKQVAGSAYLFSNPDAHSPTGVVRKDTTLVFSQPLTASTPGVLYVYEQAADGMEISLTAEIDGELKTLTKQLTAPIVRNTVNRIIVRKDHISVSLNVSFEDWENGNDTELEARRRS